ncbi:hypothetical protein [Marinicella litoralis]|uniref:Uncharacterized protein n=1 Tax=Marinicella litoralis TaxID=644220 RepID=A0A4R6XT95_9GAMM|nr:hypothetical protein [Marinicella litoralis]TDR20653.1 hypothetical protein C8D91_1628 [Marinicella litoralis]
MINLYEDVEFKRTTIIKETLKLLDDSDKRKFIVLASIHIELINKHVEFLNNKPRHNDSSPQNEYKRYFFQRSFLDLLSIIHEAIIFFDKSKLKVKGKTNKVDKVYQNIRNCIGYHYPYEEKNDKLFAIAFNVYALNKSNPFTNYHASNSSLSIFTDFSEIKWRIIYLLMKNPNWNNEILKNGSVENFETQLKMIEEKPDSFNNWFSQVLDDVDKSALEILKICTESIADLPVKYKLEAR